MNAAICTEARELDSRSGNGIDVRLLWHPADDAVSVFVYDATRNAAFEVEVDPRDALDAFQHPFAYAACRGVAYPAPHRAHDEATTAA
jgi:hypothetical protein